MQSKTGKKVIIIGGGIGGVTAAVALQKVGMEVNLFERADELREVGSGLPLWTNALRALQKLGLASTIEALGKSVTAGSVTTWRGNTLVDLRTEELLKRLGTINIVVHRAELLTALINVLDQASVHLGATCIGYEQDNTGAIARFADGKEAYGDLLIGADGLRSIIRTQMFGKRQPKYVGYPCWRGVAHISKRNLETWAWGKGYQFGITPMSNERAYWFAQLFMPEGTQNVAQGRKHEVLELFKDWHAPIPEVIEATAEKDILRNDVYQLEPMPHWSQGRITLLGDAAHAMTPNLGQGACLAIEDAVVLAECLKDELDTVAALKLYEKRRLKRANSISRLGRIIGQVVQIENPVLAGMRNVVVKRVPASVIMQGLMWIFDYEA